MYPVPGHLAYAVLGKRYFNIDWIPVIAGAMLPDLIDKPMDDIFHITPYGRYMMHSLLGMAVCVLIAYYFIGRRIAFSYFIGHMGHLIADSDFNPWLWPFYNHQFPDGITIVDIVRAPETIFFASWLLMEAAILGLSCFLFTKYARRKSVQAVVLAIIAALSVYRITRQRSDMLGPGS